LTSVVPSAILDSMRPRTQRLQALLLAALMGALASGVPTHHHGEVSGSPVLADAGHHGHGVQLVDQTDRLTSKVMVAALPAPPSLAIAENLAVAAVTPARVTKPVAQGRPPPSDRPRAPPVSG